MSPSDLKMVRIFWFGLVHVFLTLSKDLHIVVYIWVTNNRKYQDILVLFTYLCIWWCDVHKLYLKFQASHIWPRQWSKTQSKCYVMVGDNQLWDIRGLLSPSWNEVFTTKFEMIFVWLKDNISLIIKGSIKDIFQARV